MAYPQIVDDFHSHTCLRKQFLLASLSYLLYVPCQYLYGYRCDIPVDQAANGVDAILALLCYGGVWCVVCLMGWVYERVFCLMGGCVAFNSERPCSPDC
jgi:hypothetical protein